MTKQKETNTMDKVDLTKLATEINESHEQCVGAARTSLTHANKTGELLIQAKKAAAQGGWKPWVEENCRFSLREAQRYMKVARNLPKLKEEGLDTAEMTITEVLGLLRNPKPELQNGTATSANTDDADSCFRLSSKERDQRVKRFAMAPPTLPSSVAEDTDKVVAKTIAQVKRSIRSSVLKQIQPKIEDGSLEPVDVAILVLRNFALS